MVAGTGQHRDGTPAQAPQPRHSSRVGDDVADRPSIAQDAEGEAVKPFVVNRHGRLVFPANFLGELDFSVLDTLEQFTAVIGRDFEAKAPTGTDILARVESGAYRSRFELLRDLGQNLFWVNRYSMTMFDKRPTRWRDVPRHRDDVFLPVLTPWEDGERKVAAVERAYRELPAALGRRPEDRIFGLLFDVFRHKRHHATELPAIKPTVAELLDQPDALTFVLPDHDPDYPVFRIDEILDADEEVPELEALMRWAMVLHNQYPWDRARHRAAPARRRSATTTSWSRSTRATATSRRSSTGSEQAGDRHRAAADRRRRGAGRDARPRCARTRRSGCARRSRCAPALEALAVVRGEHVCDNDDVVRNASFSWSPMSAAEIARKTGIEPAPLHQPRARAARARRGPRRARRSPAASREEIGAVLVSTCTSNRLIPSVACWLSGELGLLQTHASVDLVAACAGPALRARRGGPAAAGGRAAGPAGLRGEVLRQDRQRPHVDG